MSDIGVVKTNNGYSDNIISGKKLREVQSSVLNTLSDAIINSMGPAGSNTLIIRGNTEADIVAEYTKDGNKIIKNIKFQYPIEMAIKSEIENCTRYIEKTVGDGTSSAVIMSANIFDNLCKAANDNKLPNNPYEIMRIFDKRIKLLSKNIRKKKRDCTLEDIYKISYISTNGNDYISNMLSEIYRDYGMGVFIDVAASSDENTYVKSYNGITLETGYSDPCMINNLEKGSARIRSTSDYKVRVYQFRDPVDDAEMNNYFMKIIETNIVSKRFGPNPVPEIPTVILAPKIGRDTEAYMRRIVQMMHQFPESAYSQKPQLLIVTNYAGLNENFVDHISQLCNAKPIKKYIDDDNKKLDQKNGLAPTLDNVCDFCGYCGEVEADANITRFVDPEEMYEKDDNGSIILDDNGAPVLSTMYNNIITFLEAQIKNATASGNSAGVLGSLKRQLNAVKANMVEIFVGGISISDRDSLRDLVEDAVLNCRSAAAYGVGYGANTEGFNILNEQLKCDYKSKNDYVIDEIIYDAYSLSIKSLYRSIIDSVDMTTDDPEEKLDEILRLILEYDGTPYNITTKEFDGLVLTSIESEPTILETISRIITIMFTANQALLQAPSLSQYY